jgi:diadenosine tetraphosphatase ApaH/serine/threonine PP2A family protein phosphatase
LGVDRFVCLGDVVGYGADPVSCLEAVRRRCTGAVAGNHEHGSVGLLDLDWFNPAARAAVAWTAARLSEEERAYLAKLPLTLTLHGARLVHASPRSPEAWEYLVTPRDGFGAFDFFPGRLCVVGHSHRPAVWVQGDDGDRFVPGPRAISLDRDHRFIVNVGSVGQPRDGDPRAAYAVWDLEASSVTIHRVAYDTATAQAKIYRSGLPRILGERLAYGR